MPNTEKLQQMGIDPVWLILALAAVVFVLIIVIILLMNRVHKLSMRYDLFMRGKDCETMEDNIIEMYRQLQILQHKDLANKDIMTMLDRNLLNSIAKTGLVKYNAFKGMGGESSFALTLLNLENSGHILNAVHSSNGCYLYIKEIENGSAKEELSTEEKASLEKALVVSVQNKRAKKTKRNTESWDVEDL